ncbi:hypothetical protein Tco_1401368 [Tanacetum coccineum]
MVMAMEATIPALEPEELRSLNVSVHGISVPHKQLCSTEPSKFATIALHWECPSLLTSRSELHKRARLHKMLLIQEWSIERLDGSEYCPSENQKSWKSNSGNLKVKSYLLRLPEVRSQFSDSLG